MKILSQFVINGLNRGAVFLPPPHTFVKIKKKTKRNINLAVEFQFLLLSFYGGTCSRIFINEFLIKLICC